MTTTGTFRLWKEVNIFKTLEKGEGGGSAKYLPFINLKNAGESIGNERFQPRIADRNGSFHLLL